MQVLRHREVPFMLRLIKIILEKKEKIKISLNFYNFCCKSHTCLLLYNL